MTILPGRLLGPYEILSAIGAGRIGEVCRAHDTKLWRDVAIKVLPANFVNDPERLSRFQRFTFSCVRNAARHGRSFTRQMSPGSKQG
jgi:serine/threonine protein kinase